MWGCELVDRIGMMWIIVEKYNQKIGIGIMDVLYWVQKEIDSGDRDSEWMIHTQLGTYRFPIFFSMCFYSSSKFPILHYGI